MDHHPDDIRCEIERLKEYCRELKQEIDNLKQLVFVDELTGLFNFRYLTNRLDEEINRARRHKRDFSLIMIDLDNLKEINDSFGHHMGNLVLAEIARCLKRTLRNIDIVIRFGGDEFVVMLPDTSCENSLLVGKRISRNIEDLSITCPDTGRTATVTVSGGIVSFHDYSKTGIDLMKEADRLMYKAKQSGKNQFEAMTPAECITIEN
jgi:diguanylate cyclase (GGDEF)-like protein